MLILCRALTGFVTRFKHASAAATAAALWSCVLHWYGPLFSLDQFGFAESALRLSFRGQQEMKFLDEFRNHKHFYVFGGRVDNRWLNLGHDSEEGHD